MRSRWNILVLTLIALGVLSVCPAGLIAQSAQGVPSRIGAIDESSLVTLKGNRHPLANAANDRGLVAPGLPMQRMLLVLNRDPATESTLRRLIADQQDPSSPNFHAWLSPDEFGARFGPSASDRQKLTVWLQSHGFTVSAASRGGMIIEFSGNAGQVASAFHTEIHEYFANGASHYANATDPQIPTALATVVAGVSTMNNFLKQSPTRVLGSANRIADTSQWQPNFTLNSEGEVFHFMAPGDFSRIYNVASLVQSGIDGTGQSIAIVGRSNIDISDLQIFRLAFGLPLTLPEIILNGTDPGDLFGSDETEADLDIEWAGSIAPKATIKFVVSESTNTTDGADLSSEYIVDNNIAPVMSISFGQCEATMGRIETTFYNNLWEQAAAQGITVVAASGDSGPAGCDNPNQGSPAIGGAAVSGVASTPFNIAVGGTAFNENNNFNLYWAPTNGPDQSSVLQYIPENVWNESCPSINQCGGITLFASGGGPSALYAKPSWQGGLGVPNDETRDLPDIALAAASGHDGYLVCQDSLCQTNATGQLINAEVVGGTSAGAPTFAAIMALINQKTGSRQGQANFILYPLAATQNVVNCNASQPPQASCIFNDVTVGNTNVPGQTGYVAGPGYDMATGLGSINAGSLAAAWANITFRGSSAVLQLSPTSITHGQPVNATVTVTPGTGLGTPSGEVALLTGGPGNVNLGLLTNGVATGTVRTLPGGSYSVSAGYSGDGTFGSTISNSIPVQVSPENSTTTFAVVQFNSSGNLVPITSTTYSALVDLQTTTAGLSGQGAPTGTITYSDTFNGNTTTLATSALNTRGAALVTNTSLAVGTHQLTASYSGDPSFNPSAGAPATVTVSKGPTQTLLFIPTAVAPNTELFLEALVLPTNGNALPTGTLQFFSGGTALGTPVAVNSELAVLEIVLPNGQDSITATYSGDSNFTGSTSSASVITIANPDFRIAVNPGNLSVSVGSPGVATLLLSPGTGLGFVGNVALSCSGLPSGAACTFNPQQVPMDGFTTLQSTVSISETVAGGQNHRASVAQSNVAQSSAPPRNSLNISGTNISTSTSTRILTGASPRTLAISLFGSLTLAGLLLIAACPARKRSRNLCLVLALAFVLGAMAGCNSANSSTPPPSGGQSGNTTIITVTATGSSGGVTATHSVTISVTFN